MEILIYVVSNLFCSAGLLIEFCYVVHSGKFVKGALIGWVLTIVFIILVSLVFPSIVGIYYGEYCRYFPDANGVPIVIALGWSPSMVVAIIAVLIRQIIRQIKKRWIRSYKTKQVGV